VPERVAELENGVVVHQVTDESALVDNIYCERSYCTPDSRWFVYQREVAPDGPSPWQFTAEFVACEFGTWQTRVLGRGYSYAEIAGQGTIYYARSAAGAARELVRVNVATGEADVIPIRGGVRPYTGMGISPDERFLVYGVALSFEPQMFGVEVVDLGAGERDIVCTDPCICNPHTQFDQRDGRQILVQHNRGCRHDAEGNVLSWGGEDGTALFLVGAHDGRITPLAVGRPHTARCTGHQQWIGDTREIILTTGETERNGGAGGNLLAVRAGHAPRLVARDYGFAHVHASVCGGYFCSDKMLTGEIVVGSIRTGKQAVVCNSGILTTQEFERDGHTAHAHPYLSPDLKWVVYNALRDGRPQIHAASIPPGIIESCEHNVNKATV